MSLSARRAWIEMVDYIIDYVNDASLSARRAWIEIVIAAMTSQISVRSLSARRAWIEIPAGCWRDARRVVALRKESVDRNINCAA